MPKIQYEDEGPQPKKPLDQATLDKIQQDVQASLDKITGAIAPPPQTPPSAEVPAPAPVPTPDEAGPSRPTSPRAKPSPFFAKLKPDYSEVADFDTLLDAEREMLVESGEISAELLRSIRMMQRFEPDLLAAVVRGAKSVRDALINLFAAADNSLTEEVAKKLLGQFQSSKFGEVWSDSKSDKIPSGKKQYDEARQSEGISLEELQQWEWLIELIVDEARGECYRHPEYPYCNGATWELYGLLWGKHGQVQNRVLAFAIMEEAAKRLVGLGEYSEAHLLPEGFEYSYSALLSDKGGTGSVLLYDYIDNIDLYINNITDEWDKTNEEREKAGLEPIDYSETYDILIKAKNDCTNNGVLSIECLNEKLGSKKTGDIKLGLLAFIDRSLQGTVFYRPTGDLMGSFFHETIHGWQVSSLQEQYNEDELGIPYSAAMEIGSESEYQAQMAALALHNAGIISLSDYKIEEYTKNICEGYAHPKSEELVLDSPPFWFPDSAIWPTTADLENLCG
jgi:hypothetical protein